MQKTYRSKRDAPGALDHRDVILAADAKSSLFDAFYIQNLKQTKREMSVQCPMQFAASNKVRKRKYVRRVKEKPPLTNESSSNHRMSQSTYLTPNKSIHVNRAPDLFDQLFNSSPTELKKDVFNTMQIPAKRTYTRERRNKNKRINYSTSDSSDSDKENSCDANFTRNSSDIQKHKLIIENKNSPKKVDQSIKNILNSSIFKLETEHSPVEVKSPIISRIKKVQPAVLESSPLCSTPFNQKYRGKSIYNFSPIAINIGSSPECFIIDDDREDILTDKDYVIKENNKSLGKLKKDIENCNSNNTKSSNNNTYGKCDKEKLQSNEFESIQITEEEPFLGFTNSLKTNLDTSKNQNVLLENSCTDNLTSGTFLEENKENNTNIEKEITSTNATSNSTYNSDNESLYDTCSSNGSEKLTEDEPKDPIIVLSKLNNSIFEKYYRQMPDYSLETGEISNKSESLQSLDNSSLEDETDESLEEININQDLNDTDKVNQSSISESLYNNINLEETCISFVTTRRRNKVRNGFSILALDYSYTTNGNIVNNSSVNDSQLKEDAICDSTIISENIESNNDFEEEKTVKDNSINRDIKNNDSFNKTDSFKISNDPSVVRTVNSITTRKSSRLTKINDTDKELPIINILPVENSFTSSFEDEEDLTHGIVLQPGKKWERSLSIYRRMTTMADHFDQSILDSEDLKSKGRKYRQSVICTMEMQDKGSYNDSISSRRSTFSSKPSRTSIKLNNEKDASRVSTCFDDEVLKGFLNEDCDDTVIELSKLSIADRNPEVTIIENVHDTSHRGVAARDYVLRRCGQTDAILFDECYPDTVLKNCRKIGEGVYGEVFLWRARDGHARVLKVIPVGGTIKVNGENQKGFGEIISEIVIAMELSALRAPILEIKQHIDEGKDIETLDLHSIANATDVFNEVLAVRCVHGSYPSRLLDLWDLYDECKGSENDNPAVLPVDQQFIVLELANAGQDLESYQFNNAEQAYSIFKQVAFGLAVAEEAYQFEHRDLHWGNILIAPTEEKWAVFVLRGRAVRVLRRGVAATVIDYSLSRLARRPGARALHLDLSQERELFAGRGDYQFDLYRLMRRALGNNWANYEPYTNVLWLHYTIDKMITSLRYSRPNTKIHKQYIAKLAILKEQLLNYRSATELVLTNNDL